CLDLTCPCLIHGTCQGDPTLQELTSYLLQAYGIPLDIVGCGTGLLWASWMPAHRHQARMGLKYVLTLVPFVVFCSLLNLFSDLTARSSRSLFPPLFPR